MNTCHFGDCRDSMRRLIGEGQRVQMCVTSPPYYGLRDYGTGRWEGGDPACDHKGAPLASNKNTLGGGAGQVGPGFKVQEFSMPFLGKCGKCGATRIDGQLGLEETPEQYVANMVEVFRIVREMLADDGTLWLNLGDSYAAQRSGTHQPAETLAGGRGGYTSDGGRVNRGRLDGKNPTRDAASIGLKHKDLIGIPWLVAFALQADGWYLRQDIIWHKPNPMPESVRDRCTKAHEYLFLLSKSPRYFFDAEAIAEPLAPSSIERLSQSGLADQVGSDRVPGKTNGKMKAVPPRFGGSKCGDDESKQTRNKSGNEWTWAEKRNRRSVWTIPTQPFSGAHFAVFPPALVKPCILAGSRVGDAVLDPFFGSGTTGQVAQELGRNWIGCELNEDYRTLQYQRTAQSGLKLEDMR